ncbi:MAG: putative enzyme [Promethearchaeota archaeon]|nr:MAG: putative enzyme [Candidatus Lokiarchaeota archaeon]
MDKDIAFVIYYTNENKFSFNALVAAIESDRATRHIDIYYIEERKELMGRLGKIANDYKTVVVGVSFFTTQIWEIKNLIKKLKRRHSKNIVYIAGGPHPSGDPERTLKMGFDIVVHGEGEKTTIELLKALKNKNSIKDIKGISYMDKTQGFKRTPNRPLVDLNEYPLFPMINTNYGSLEITRGCPYMCYFCQVSFICGKKPRHRSIDNTLKFIRIMKEEDLTDIRFITPNAFSYGSEDGKELNLPILEELLVSIKEIIKPSGRIFFGSFPSEVRPEHINQQTIELVKKYASNDNIVIGAQSGSQRILDKTHRGHTTEDIYNAVEMTINSGLKANVDFILGLPGINKEDIALTMEMMKNLVKIGARIHAHSFIPLPQTPFERKIPPSINNKMREFIVDLNHRGHLYGNWRKQEKLAKKISKYLRKT